MSEQLRKRFSSVELLTPLAERKNSIGQPPCPSDIIDTRLPLLIVDLLGFPKRLDIALFPVFTPSPTGSQLMSASNVSKDDGVFQSLPPESDVPAGVDRRSFLMRNAVIGAAAAMTGTTWTPQARARQAAKEA